MSMLLSAAVVPLEIIRIFYLNALVFVFGFNYVMKITVDKRINKRMSWLMKQSNDEHINMRCLRGVDRWEQLFTSSVFVQR